MISLEDATELPVEKERSTVTPYRGHDVTLRSHTKAAQKELDVTEANAKNTQNATTYEQETAFIGYVTPAIPSDRDFQEYLPSRLAFYNKMEHTAENKYSFETFTHQAYSAMVRAYRISVRQTLQEHNADKRKANSGAVEAEIKQLMDIGAIHPIRVKDLGEQERKRIIPSYVFLKEKQLANGDFDRMKARLVARGNFVDARSVGETNATNVNPLTVFFMLNVAAQYGLRLLTADIKGTYLITNIAEGGGQTIYIDVWIEKSLTEMFVKLHPNLRTYVYHNGKLVFKLRKYLYGLPQAAYNFHQYLSESMKILGFVQLKSDWCAWPRGTGSKQLYARAHVDDLLFIRKPEAPSQFDQDIIKPYEITVLKGLKHSYIGLDILQLRGSKKVIVSQKGFHRELVNKCADDIKTVRPRKTSCDPSITEDPSDNDPESS